VGPVVVAGVESDRSAEAACERGLRVQLLGPLTIRKDGRILPLPTSRKVRALFAYLAVTPAAVSRPHLCELLWEIPNDPRGELRWCLSKIRKLLDADSRTHVVTADDTVRLDLTGGSVDALEVARAIESGIETLTPARQRALCESFQGEFLDGLEVGRSPLFDTWVTAQRRRFRSCHAALLEHLVAHVPDDEAFAHLEAWLELSPFDRHVHERFLAALARTGRIREGEEHLAAASRLFDAEGLDSTALRDVWRSARARHRSPSPVAPAATASRRASIAVMPFADGSNAAAARGGTADALAHDVITRLAQLRSLFVIAQGTVFALNDRGIGPEEAGRMLDVDYVVGGRVRLDGGRLGVTVELSETRSARIVWADTFDQPAGAALHVLDEIGNRIVASIANEIEAVERNRALLRPPSSLDAWEAHHRGLWHMYRFTRADNTLAQQFFEMAVQLDPTFARAWAGLSFTHFQNAFQGWAPRAQEVERARTAAGQSLMVDERDPAAHWAMGRALWLEGRHEPAITEVERSIDLSPNFALGHYTLAFIHSQAGDAHAAIAASDQARKLSPFDPLLFGMLAARAMALVRLGRFDDAAPWARKAAGRANAHPHIHAIAAMCLARTGALDEARDQVAAIQRSLPGYRVADFLGAFQFDAAGVAVFRESARRIGME